MRKMIGLAVMAMAVCGMAAPTTVCLPGRAFHEITRRQHTGIPSIAVSPKRGRLWVTFYCGETRGEDRNSYVPLLTSGDGGRTWKEVLYADPDESGPRRAFDPQVWVAPDGRLRWSWTDALCDTSKDDYSRDYGGNEGIRSTHVLKMATLDADAEPTEAPPTVDVGRGVMMGKPIVLDSGEWLFPSAHWDDDPSGCFYVTTDGGKTFTPRGGVTIPKNGRGVEEHYVVQRTNGDLVTYLRGAWESNGRRTNPWMSESKDRGTTWTPAVPAPFAHTSSRACVIRLASGGWLLVKHGNFNESNGRRNLKAFLSRDEGRTWTGGLPIAGGLEWISYPDACQKPDGTIVVVYDYQRLDDQEISYDEFTEEDVSAGRPVSGRCRFRNVILRKHQLTGAKPPTATESDVVARASNGRYWATWFASAGNTEDVNTYVVLATSADGDSCTWVFPNDWEPFGCETFPELRKFTGCGVYALTTDGAWERRGFAVPEESRGHHAEHCLVENADGSLRMVMRTLCGLMECASTDQGRTWTKPRPTETFHHVIARFMFSVRES